MHTIINFGGFYHSIHAQLVEDAVEMMFSDDEGTQNEQEIEIFDFIKAYNDYSIAYIDKLEDWIADELYIDKSPSFKFVRLQSPKFYNYSTDKIVIDITKKDAKAITKALLKSDDHNDQFKDFVIEATTSRSGYIPFYTFEEAMKDKDDVLIMFALEYLAGCYNAEDLLCSIHEVNVFEAIF